MDGWMDWTGLAWFGRSFEQERADVLERRPILDLERQTLLDELGHVDRQRVRESGEHLIACQWIRRAASEHLEQQDAERIDIGMVG